MSRPLNVASAMVVLAAAMALLDGCGRGDGAGQRTWGRVESALGSITGDAQLKRQGRKDEVIGGVKSTIGDLKDAVHDATKK